MFNTINNIFAIIFYAVMFCWIFSWIRNKHYVKKFDCEEKYKDIKREITEKKEAVVLMWISLSIILPLVVLSSLYLGLGFIIIFGAIFIFLITLGGIAYVDTGANPSIFRTLINFASFYFELFKYAYLVYFLIYIAVFVIFIRLTYINLCVYKEIKNGL